MQSTRAGADLGFQLIIVVLLINLLKYPFFEYGHRYPVATGENLLDGYRLMGSGFLYAFMLLAAVTAVGSIAGVTFVTAGIAQYFFGNVIPPIMWSVVVMAICVGLLVGGHYRALDSTMKVIMAVLAVATVVAVGASVIHGPVAAPGFVSPSPWNFAALPFLIALMGWMPAPIEISVFQSLWIQAKDRDAGRRTTLEEARFDFNFGYGLTIVLVMQGRRSTSRSKTIQCAHPSDVTPKNLAQGARASWRVRRIASRGAGAATDRAVCSTASRPTPIEIPIPKRAFARPWRPCPSGGRVRFVLSRAPLQGQYCTVPFAIQGVVS